jgi:hypothetical protein
VRHFLSIVFGAAFTSAVAWSIGRFLFSRLRITLRRVEHELLAGITGAAILSLVVFLLCATHLAIVPVFWVIGLAAIAMNWKFGAASEPGNTDPLPGWWQWLFTMPVVYYAVVYLSNSVAPENSPDGESYHLGFVYRYFRQHGFERLTTNMYGNLSQGMEMLFLFAFSFGRHAAAATVHCCFLFALPLMLLSYGKRIGHPMTGACAGMLFFLSPLAGIDGVSAYNDVSLAAAGFAVFYLLEIWRESKQAALLIPIGLVAGFCFAIKYTGFVAPVYAICIVAWELRGNKRMLLSLATVAGLVTLMAAPWLLKNWIWLGNPVSPFMNRLFPNPFIHISFEDEYRRYFRTYELPSLKPLFWMVTVTGRLGGQLGPIFLLTPLALLSLRKPEGRRVLLAGLFFLLPYPQNLSSRFLLPCLPYAALGIALALEFSPRAQAAVVMLSAFLACPQIIFKYSDPGGNWQIAGVPWKAALGIIPQDKYLLDRNRDWVTARMLDEFVPRGKRVWSTLAIAESYSAAEVLVYYYSAESELIQDILSAAMKPNFQPLRNLRYTFAPRTLSRVRLVQNAQSPTEIWSIGQMNVFLGSEEIRPVKIWQIKASTFPWDLALAFDRNPVTRWRSWEPMHPGMWIDVNFGAPVQMDRVELHCSPDEQDVDVKLEGVNTSLTKLDEPPSEDLRRLATETIRKRGIDYLLIAPGHWLTADIESDPERWGLKKIADRGDAWLYQIQ